MFQALVGTVWRRKMVFGLIVMVGLITPHDGKASEQLPCLDGSGELNTIIGGVLPGGVVWEEAGSPKAGWTQLHRAAYDGSAERVEHLLLGGHDVNEVAQVGEVELRNLQSMLDQAYRETSIGRMYFDLFSYLSMTKYCIDVLVDGASRRTPRRLFSSEFCSARCQDCLRNFKRLEDVEGNRDCNEHCPTGWASVIGALESQRPRADDEAFESVLGRFMVLNALEGATALHIAAGRGHLNVIRKLIEGGARVDRRTQWGGTALLWAVSTNQLHVMNSLIKAGADVNAVGPSGYTILHVAAMVGAGQAARVLMSHGANVNAAAEHDITPVDLAIAFRDIPLEQQLTNSGGFCRKYCHCLGVSHH